MTEEELITLLQLLPFQNRIPAGTLPEITPGGYDMTTALASGLGADSSQHFPSRVPFGLLEGLILKEQTHPTFHKTLAAEKEIGNKVIRRKKRLFSFPKDVVKEIEQRELRGRARGEPPRGFR